MSKNLYKYVASEHIDKVCGSNKYVTLKCSYPKDFNDPYELFLTIDFKERPDALAFYADVVGNIPQLPTTCFSRSPIIIPMWAHYAHSHQGFVIEFNEAKLAQSFPNSGFGDINYRDEPEESLTDMLYRASVIGKPRYLYLLQQGVFSAAYYTKTACWSYEQERRMIARDSEIRRIDDIILIDIPKECVTALACGSSASPETARKVREKAAQIGCKYYELKIGKSSATPFFMNLDGDTFLFNGTDIEHTSQICDYCKEPLTAGLEKCSLCQIEHIHKISAAERNVFRMLSDRGLLDDYIAGMNDIGRKTNK